MNESSSQTLLVIGAGIAGMTAALEAAEAGRDVILVEREPSVGGRVLRIHNYFPKLCPPSCGMEINVRRLEKNPRIKTFVGAEVTGLERGDNGWSVKITVAPKYVNQNCTACGDCAKVCPAKIADTFNLGMNETTAIRLPHQDAWPKRFTLERGACPDGCKACVDACRYKAIDLDAQAAEESFEVGAVVNATGWKPYPLENLTELGGGQYKDVIANVNFERLAAPAGPTGGKIIKPSDGKPPAKIAFVQCAGSRDVNHLPYCSAVCCLASLKHAMYAKEQLPDAEVTIYYIDRRAPGRTEDVLTKAAELEGVNLVKGKVGGVEQTGSGLKLRLEDVEAGTILEPVVDLVVLATGMVPNLKEEKQLFGLKLDDDGFGLDDKASSLFVAGVAKRPEDVASSVRDATGAAAKAAVAAERSA